jgi:hypothetical protein
VPFGTDPDPRIRASHYWIWILLRLRILLFSSLAFKTPQKTSVADPGSGAFLTPGSQTHIFESLVTIFWGKKFYNSLKIDPNFFLQHSKTKIICNFVKFVATLKVMTTKFFSPLSFVAVFGSGIRDPG